MPRSGPFSPVFKVKKRRGAINPGVMIGTPPVVEPIYATLEFVGRVTNATNLNGPVGLVASGDLIVVASGASGTDVVAVIDASTPASPTIVGFDADSNFNGPGCVELIDATHAIVTCGANLGRISTVDFTVPGAAVLFDGTDDDSTNFFNNNLGVAVVGANAFISGSGVLGTVDVSAPGTPTFTNVEADATNYADSLGRRPCVATGSHLLLTATNQLTVADVSSPNAPTVVGTLVDATHIGSTGPGSVDVAGDIAAVLGGTGWLTIVDVSDLTDPQPLGYLQVDTTSPYLTRDCRIVGNYVVVAALSSTFLIDITDPTTPTQIDDYPNDGFTGSVQYLCRLGVDMVALSSVSDDTITILRLTPP